MRMLSTGQKLLVELDCSFNAVKRWQGKVKIPFSRWKVKHMALPSGEGIRCQRGAEPRNGKGGQ